MKGEVSGEGDPAKVREEEVSSSAVHRVEGIDCGCNAAPECNNLYQSLHETTPYNNNYRANQIQSLVEGIENNYFLV